MYMQDKEHSSLFKNLLLYNVDQSYLQKTSHTFIPNSSRSFIHWEIAPWIEDLFLTSVMELRMCSVYSWARGQCFTIKDRRLRKGNIRQHQRLYSPESPGVCLHHLLPAAPGGPCAVCLWFLQKAVSSKQQTSNRQLIFLLFSGVSESLCLCARSSCFTRRETGR